MPRWRIPLRAPVALAAAGLLLSGCANPSVGSADDDPAKPVTLKFWHGWSAPGEVKAINDSIARFEKLHPNIRVQSTGNVTDATINQALRAGGDEAPDVVTSFTTNNVGQYCDSGMWADLDPFMRKSGLDKAKVFPKTLLDYTSYDGNQCALPLLADAYGMYYNKDAFKEAGISRRRGPCPSSRPTPRSSRSARAAPTSASASCRTSACTRTAPTGSSPSGAPPTSTPRAIRGSRRTRRRTSSSTPPTSSSRRRAATTPWSASARPSVTRCPRRTRS